jgi:hypothetical protein
MKSLKEIKIKIEEMELEKNKLDFQYNNLSDSDDEDIVNHLVELDIEIYVLDKNIRLLYWILNE